MIRQCLSNKNENTIMSKSKKIYELNQSWVFFLLERVDVRVAYAHPLRRGASPRYSSPLLPHLPRWFPLPHLPLCWPCHCQRRHGRARYRLWQRRHGARGGARWGEAPTTCSWTATACRRCPTRGRRHGDTLHRRAPQLRGVRHDVGCGGHAPPAASSATISSAAMTGAATVPSIRTETTVRQLPAYFSRLLYHMQI
jgi:hypothetical protein